MTLIGKIKIIFPIAIILLGYLIYNFLNTHSNVIELILLTIIPIFLTSLAFLIYDDEIYKLSSYLIHDITNGIKKTKKNDLEKEFKKSGGIIGFKDIKIRHIALIIPSQSEKDLSSFKKKEIEPYIEYYDSKNINWQLYLCFLSEDFLKLIKSKNVFGLHIFGHGYMKGLIFKDGLFSYRECKNFGKKEYVAQHHCNHRGKIEDSLAYLIGINIYLPKGKIHSLDIIKDAEKLKDGKFWKKIEGTVKKANSEKRFFKNIISIIIP